MATTTRGIPYPDDYGDAADVPAVVQSLAAAVDGLIGTVDTKATNAASSAASAGTSATAASQAVAAHTHNGSGSVNIGITAVSGLSTALNAKSDSTHDHNAAYATLAHTHSSAELAAHTHSDYAPTAHTHTQAQSHTTPDTDTATTAIHHTIGTGPNQAAAGNHLHSAYADTNHNHTGYAATVHDHNASYSLLEHTHNYASTSHTHAAADVASGTLSVSRIPTGTTSATVATGDHTHTTLGSLTLTTLSVSGASVSLAGAAANRGATDYPAGFNGNILRATTSSQRYKTDIVEVDGTLADVDIDKRGITGFTDPYDVLELGVADFQWLEDGKPTDKRALGFIAEDVAAKLPIACAFDEYGMPAAVKDTAILAALLAVVRSQQQAITDLQGRIQALENK